MDDPLDVIKNNLLGIYSKFEACGRDIQLFKRSSTDLMTSVADASYDIIVLTKRGIPIPAEYRTAAIRALRVTSPSTTDPKDIQEYVEVMERIKNGQCALSKPTMPVPAQTYEPPKPANPPLKKPKAVRIKSGTSTFKLKDTDTLDTKILRAIMTNPRKNPYKQQHAEYFKARTEEQKKAMQTPNPNPRGTQEQKDAYYAFQTETLASNACSISRWSGLKQECEKISEELSKEPDYDPAKLLEFYGIELACMKIIKKERLPDELVRIMCELR